MFDIRSALPLEPLEHARLGAALNAVRAAITVCRRVQQHPRTDTHVKTDHSPVTIADFASQAVVVHALRRGLGPIELVAEEESAVISALGAEYVQTVVNVVRDVWPEATADAVQEAIAAGNALPCQEGFWTLDPVDGTKGFLRNQHYAIALAFIERGRPSIAVLGCPNLPSDAQRDPTSSDGTGVICFAVEGRGAFEVPVDDRFAPPRRLHGGAANFPDAVRMCVSVEKAHRDAGTIDTVIQHIGGTCRTVTLDSQCKYAVVARGQADVYLRVPPSPDYTEWIWDHAAGRLIATEAGCRVTDLAGQSLDFTRGRRLDANRGVLCATSAWHQPLLDALRVTRGGPLPAEVGNTPPPRARTV